MNMEGEISAFAAYRSSTKKKVKRLKKPKAKPTAAKDLVKQFLIDKIIQSQFSDTDVKKPKKKKRKSDKIESSAKKTNKLIENFEKKIITSTPVASNGMLVPKKEPKSFINMTKIEEGECEEEQENCQNGYVNEDVPMTPLLKESKKKFKIKLFENLHEKTDINLKVKDIKSSFIEIRRPEVSPASKNADKTGKISTTPKTNSINEGEKILKWLITPVEIKPFFQKFWEKSPCLVQRKSSSYYGKLLSFGMIDKMLLDHHVEFTKNIDITSYTNGIRETLNPEGRALPGAVWEKYAEGCSIRLLNPQTFLPSIFAMNTTLQEYFHCMIGANVYLTPPNSQGFAPHYDDIEAFVLQIEGKKRWRLYNPRTKNEELPRFSSGNFQQNEIGEAILEKTLEPGDTLYFPRGTIHQANTVPGHHSLHITLSVYQRQSYADLFEKLFPLILNRAITEDIELRRGLPLYTWSNMGVVYSDVNSNERNTIFKHVKECLKRAIQQIPLDDAVDQLAKKFQHEALPPDLSAAEKCRTVFGSKTILNVNGEAVSSCEINLDTRIRLLRANILRLLEEEDKVRVYFYVDNSKEYQEYEPNFMEIEPEDANAVDVLIKCYPDYMYVKDLPLDDDERKIGVIQALWERGILMLSDPL